MATLKKAHDELFRRTPDEAYESFDELYETLLEAETAI